jgi:hypothetical protein
MKTQNANKSKWTLAIYFALSFFILGASAMIHFFVYPTFDKVHEHISAFMELFNSRIIFVLYIPLLLLLFTSISLFWFAPKTFPKWTIGVSVVLLSIATITIFFVLNPIQHSFSETGFDTTQYNNLLLYSLTFQLIPFVLQAILALTLLNKFSFGIKGKWVFIALFTLAFYTAGTDFVEKLLNYPSWLYVSENEWMSFRLAVKSIALVWIYLLPAFLPLLLLILMFWFRPVTIKKQTVVIYLGLYLFISIITSIYFVPKLQIPLDKTYSRILIEQLTKMDFPLRFFPALITYALATFMFLKIEKD